MNDSDREQLDRLVGPVSRETLDRLNILVDLVTRWSTRINLIGPSTSPEIWRRHILDSAQLLPIARQPMHWVDLGSGGGFPGMVVAILLAERNAGAQVTLVESNRKKTSFLQIAAGTLSLRHVKVLPTRIEKGDNWSGVSHVSARALAPLRELLALSAPLLAPGVTALFHKGRDFSREIAEADSGWRFDVVCHPNKVEPEGAILEISNLRPRP